jgi:ubiquinone/menaquinone biosynthesis C-methylase UbiE
MDNMRNTDNVKQQYTNSDNLNIRISIHTKYSMNKQGYSNWINEQYKLFHGCRILELGCGNGDMWKDNIKNIGNDSNLILSDFSEGMVEEVKKKYEIFENVSVQQINIEEIPYKENSFDIVIANMMLYHVPNLDKALSEVARVLKTNGTFYSATFGENGIHEYILTALNDKNIHKVNTFTLQNGSSILSKYFNNVIKMDYIDALEVTDTYDLINYIYSMASIINVKEDDRNKLFELFESRKDGNGVIRIPKEYGMFISKK